MFSDVIVKFSQIIGYGLMTDLLYIILHAQEKNNQKCRLSKLFWFSPSVHGKDFSSLGVAGTNSDSWIRISFFWLNEVWITILFIKILLFRLYSCYDWLYTLFAQYQLNKAERKTMIKFEISQAPDYLFIV